MDVFTLSFCTGISILTFVCTLKRFLEIFIRGKRIMGSSCPEPRLTINRIIGLYESLFRQNGYIRQYERDKNVMVICIG